MEEDDRADDHEDYHTNTRDPSVDLLCEWMDGRNNLFQKVLIMIPPSQRHTVMTSMLTNEFAFLGMMARLHNEHVRQSRSTTHITLSMPLNMNATAAALGTGLANPAGFMDAVPVIATPEQISAAVVREDSLPSTPINCAICQDSIGGAFSRIRFCNHIYHEICLTTWLQTSVRCPVCRHDIRETGPVAETSAGATQTSSQ
jgi:hypothetical protein